MEKSPEPLASSSEPSTIDVGTPAPFLAVLSRVQYHALTSSSALASFCGKRVA